MTTIQAIAHDVTRETRDMAQRKGISVRDAYDVVWARMEADGYTQEQCVGFGESMLLYAIFEEPQP